jgi:hypothetical protein
VYHLAMFINFNLEFSGEKMKVSSAHRVKRDVRSYIFRSCSFASFFGCYFISIINIP